MSQSTTRNSSFEDFLVPGSVLLMGVIISLSIFYAPRIGDSSSSSNSNDNSATTNSGSAGCDGDNRLSDDCLLEYASNLELDTDKFQECVDDKTFDDVVTAEFDYGVSIGVGGTPSVFIAKEEDGDLQGFQVGAVSRQNIELLVDRLTDDSAKDVQEFWLDQQLEGIDDIEGDVRDFFAGADGGSLEGDDLDTAVKDYLDGQEEDVRNTFRLVDLDLGDGLVDGSSDVYMMEFSDYECPFCQQFAAGELQNIKDAFDGDELTFVYRDFPLESIHPRARTASNAARCAGEQDKYFEYHDQLFGVS